jgi:hypothetical protein
MKILKNIQELKKRRINQNEHKKIKKRGEERRRELRGIKEKKEQKNLRKGTKPIRNNGKNPRCPVKSAEPVEPARQPGVCLQRGHGYVFQLDVEIP